MSNRGEPLVLFGGGGHARSIRDVVDRAGGRIAYVVAPEIDGFDDIEHLTSDDEGLERTAKDGLGALLGIGDQRARLGVADRLEASGIRLPPLVAGTSTVAASALLGAGTIVMEHAHVGPRARAGRACVINTAAIVEHDVDLGHGSFVSPGASLLGGVVCGERVMVGAGAVVLPGCSLGDDAVVGAGAMVREDVGADVLVAGVPAEPIQPSRRAR